MPTKTGDELIAEILASDLGDHTKIVSDLMAAFGKGYSIDNLGRLFASESSSVRGDAAFIANELGHPPRQFMREIAACMENETAYTRHDAIQALRRCATWEDGWAIGAILLKLEDTWPGVRWTVVNEIRIMARRELDSGLRFLHRARPGSIYATFLRAHHRIERGAVNELQTLIAHENPVARLFGAGLALRPRLVVDDAFVRVARASTDDEVRKLIKDGTDHILPPWAIGPIDFTA